MKRSLAGSMLLLACSYPALAHAERVAVGAAHTCAISAQRLWCWGENGSGQLGLDASAALTRPTRLDALGADVTSVAAGAYHTCALKADGSLWCWGFNGNGELGIGSFSSERWPTPVSALGNDVTALAAGRSHTCALKSDGSLWCWGSNDDGRLGDGTTQRRSSPTAVAALGSGVMRVAAGVGHTCALESDGSLWCWGFNGLGALGDGTLQSRWLPTPVSALGNTVADVSTGAHTCARTSDSRLWCWGWNLNGQLGDGSNFNRSTPFEVGALLVGVTEASAGWRHSCAVKTDGKLRCWGYNAQGTLGDGTLFQRSFPVLSQLADSVVEVAAGDDHTCAWGAQGQLWCTGFNQSGQLGLGDTTARRAFAPVTFTAPAAVSAPAAGPIMMAFLLLTLGGVGANRVVGRSASRRAT